MKKIIAYRVLLAAGMLALFIVPGIPQERPTGPPPGGFRGGPGRGFNRSEDDIKRQVTDLSENLNLSDAQQKELIDYELEFNTKMQVEFEKMRNNGGPPDREAMRDRMRKVREERDNKYREVLTEDQMKKYEAIQEERRAQMRERYQQNAPPERGTGGNQGEGGDRPARGRGRN